MQNNKINFVKKKKLKHGCITDDFFFQKFAENGLDLKLGIISVKQNSAIQTTFLKRKKFTCGYNV